MTKVLVIDDEEIIRKRLQDLLILDDYEAVIAEDGTTGLVVFDEHLPDIAVVDLKMPGMDGIAVLREIKKRSKHTEVIILTGHGGVESAIEALKEGAFGYLQKPVEYDELELEIKRACERIDIRKQLDRHIVDLEQALRERDEALKSAERASTAKGRFLADMSHEIRTPLNSVVGFVSLLADTPLSDEQREYITRILSAGDSLMSVINDVLDISKIESGKLELEHIEFPLRTLINDVAGLLQPAARDKGLDIPVLIDAAVPEQVRGDPGRLRQILINLVNNAIKFTPSGEVVVAVEHKSRREDEIILGFEVQDTGIGIAPEKQNELFHAFTQEDAATSRKYGGTGLGLSIARQLVEVMGGQLTLQSEKGRGTTFSFSLPFTASNKSPHTISSVERSIEGTTICVVSPHGSCREMVATVGAEWGCIVSQAEDIHSAITILDSFISAGDALAVVFIDADALHTVEDIPDVLQQHIKNRTTRFVLVTSGGSRGDAAHAGRIGFSTYLTRPISVEMLHDCISREVNRDTTTTSEPSLITRHSLRESRTRPLRILLVEDHRMNQLLAAAMLQHRGFHCDIARNGREAVAAVNQTAYDIVLMDCEMPEMDGYEATRLIRSREAGFRHTPVIALTANALTGNRDTCIEAGMDDYLTKPFTLEKMMDMIERWVHTSENAVLCAHDGAGESGENVLDDPIPGIPVLARRLQIDERAAERVARQLSSECPDHIRIMRAALDNRDTQAGRREAHRFKGAAANIGLTVLAGLLEDLEQSFSQERIGRVAQILDECDRWCVRLGERYGIHTDTPDDLVVPPIDSEKLKTIESLLSDGDFPAIAAMAQAEESDAHPGESDQIWWKKLGEEAARFADTEVRRLILNCRENGREQQHD